MAASQFAYAQPQQLYAESGLQGQQYGGLQGQLGLQGQGGLQGLQGQGGQGQQVLLLAPGQQQQQLGGYAYGLNPYVLQNAGGQQQLIGAGAGVRVPAGPEVQQLYANRKGGPAFFDSTTGVFFDGQQAYVYQAAPYGARSSGSLLNVATAVPLSANGISASGGRLLIGNGTVGNLEEHRNARGSVYILDNRL
ncbi:hypothetical protein AAVH_05650 [Aphelenchoides avenae]|nr:hypothetical protein AAVH_05650 [Aphelenchus avenae]